MKGLPRDMIMLSTADWDNPFWTNKQHMAAQLAQRGFRVLYVESTGLRRPTADRKDFLRIVRRLLKGLRGARKQRDNIWVYSPVVIPFHGWRIIRRINEAILTAFLRHYSSRLGFRDPIVWTYNPMSAEIAKDLRGSLIVYHCVDDLSSVPGMATDAIRKGEADLISSADMVFTTSNSLMERCSAINPADTYYFPNVVDFEHFSRGRRVVNIPEDLMRVPRPRIGFIGAVSDYKVDFELISYIAKHRPDWHWVLIGEVGEGQPKTSIEKLMIPNIHLLGPRSYETLPEYLAGFDVATIPAIINDYTQSMFPMKFFEYLAAGKPVVTTDLPSIRDFSTACLVADSPEAFLRAIGEALEGDVPNDELCSELSRKHTWQWRLEQMMGLIKRKVEEHGRKE